MWGWLALSFLVVGVVAVVFHPRTRLAGIPSAEAQSKTEPGSTQPISRNGGGAIAGRDAGPIASAADVYGSRGEALGTGPRLPRTRPTARLDGRLREPHSQHRSTSKACPPGRRPASVFTDVGQGESITDVAPRLWHRPGRRSPLARQSRSRQPGRRRTCPPAPSCERLDVRGFVG